MGNAGSASLATPLVSELAGRWMSRIPELLEGFLEQISPDGFEIVAEETAASILLLFHECLDSSFFPRKHAPVLALPFLFFHNVSSGYSLSRAGPASLR
jgi:hypothetical protein